ncbi:MAG: hypothetical protein GXY49_05140 [Syntrophomonadaceae bacterium]|nr:hypothetical protein [Syntrophomonadaceae bacterium]
MKKGSTQKNKKVNQTTNPEEIVIENLKYEVGQEMGIKPKTKNKKS